MTKDTFPEWSKGVNSSSTSASCVGTFSCKSCLLACDACENNRKHAGRPHRLSKPTRGSGTRTHARKPHRLSRPTSQPPAPTSSPAASTRGDPISLASRRAGAGLEPTRANPTGEVSLDAILFQLQSDVGYAVPYQRLVCLKCMVTLWVLFVKCKAPEISKEDPVQVQSTPELL